MKARIASASVAALVLGLFIIGASGGSLRGGGPTASVAAPPVQGIQISDAQRRATTIDYHLLDARLQQLAQEDSMVGLAVGIVEDGEIRFLKGRR